MKKQSPVDFSNVRITGGYWEKRQRLNEEVTIEECKRIWEYQAGNQSRLKKIYPDRKTVDLPKEWENITLTERILCWYDFEKWIMAVSQSILCGHEDRVAHFIPFCDLLIDKIEEMQQPDGYYNRFVMATTHPLKKFQNRNACELMLMGHLIEGGIAYYHATGKRKLLDCAIRMADCIEKNVRIDKTAAYITDGHQGIEQALVDLYRETGDERYLNLCSYCIEERGRHLDVDKPLSHWFNNRLDQSHLPVREQLTAEGHGVRALFMYNGMANLAYENGDESLVRACKTLFESITEKRMYLTGGIGSTHLDEGFTYDYDLPNDKAYCETCSSYSMIIFCMSMLLLENDSRYADTLERVLYNAFLSGNSLDGKKFFYENPLEMDPKMLGQEIFKKIPFDNRTHMWQERRNDTNICCLTNVARLVPIVGGFAYTRDADTLYVHQYLESDARISLEQGEMHITQQTQYPADGQITLEIRGASPGRIALRIPGWCQNWAIFADGKCVTPEIIKGYAYLSLPANTITLNLDMPPFLVEAHPFVHEDGGLVAVQRGPVVYCMEEMDNGPYLKDIRLDPNAPITPEENALFPFPVLKATGFRRDKNRFSGLYQRYTDARSAQDLTLIPYFTFANRGKNEMLVWMDHVPSKATKRREGNE